MEAPGAKPPVDEEQPWFVLPEERYAPSWLGRLVASCPSILGVPPYVMGMAWGGGLSFDVLLLALLLCVVVAVLGQYVCYASSGHVWRQLLVGTAVVLGCYSAGALRMGIVEPPEFLDGPADVELTGHVVQERKVTDGRTTLLVEVDTLTTSDGRLLMRGRGLVQFDSVRVADALGRRIECRGSLRAPHSNALSSFDYRSWLLEQRYLFEVEADSGATFTASGFSLTAAMGALRANFERQLTSAGVAPQDIDFLRALVLADRSRLSPALRQAFVDCGTAHVLAVSGLHVGFLVAFALYLFRHLWGINLARYAALVVLWLYAALVGLAPSIVRASVMYTFMLLALIRGRAKVNPLHALLMAVFVIVAFDPLAVLGYGLWLSVASVAAIQLVMTPLNEHTAKWPRLKKWFWSSLVLSLATQIATSPIILRMTGQFPTYFWLNNLWLLPLIGPLFVLTLFCWALSVVPVLSSLCAFMVSHLLHVVQTGVMIMSQLPSAVLSGPCLTLPAMFVLLLVAVWLLFFAVHRRRWMLLPLWASVVGFVLCLAIEQRGLLLQEGAALYTAGRQFGVVVYRGTSGLHYLTDPADTTLCDVRDRVDRHLSLATTAVRELTPDGGVGACPGLRVLLPGSLMSDIDSLDVVVVAKTVNPRMLPPCKRLLIVPACNFPQLFDSLHNAQRLRWRDYVQL